jgi:phosphomannomutase
MRVSADELMEKIENRAGYDKLWRVVDYWSSTEQVKEEYLIFTTEFLRSEEHEVDPEAVDFLVGMFVALMQGSASEPTEKTLKELGAAKGWVQVEEAMAEHALEEPEARLPSLVDAVRNQLMSNGLNVEESALTALCAVQVALTRP